ncbi:hypothetical protein EFM26_05645 [Limosilactobacillus fermentum]|nr:hypothetical protein [Limosilactobacillus fermentum]MCT2918047.1 hypothetical protein [Limosilactobacillus fermentum]
MRPRVIPWLALM